MPNWLILFGFGVVSAVAGIYALLNPFPATLAVTMIAGWSFTVVGALQLYAAWRDAGLGGRFWDGLLGLAALIMGVSLLANPLAGIISLTLLIAAVLLLVGVLKLIYAFRIPSGGPRGVVALSGAVSAVLGIMILSDFPVAAASVLGILLGIELISNGVFGILIGLSMRRLRRNG